MPVNAEQFCKQNRLNSMLSKTKDWTNRTTWKSSYNEIVKAYTHYLYIIRLYFKFLFGICLMQLLHLLTFHRMTDKIILWDE